MHLDPRGDVRACCQNTWQKLGNVTESSLKDIWRGGPANELRQRLADGDLSLGCELCAVEFDLGSPDAAFLHNYDHLPLRPEGGGWPRQLELALSIACNLQCVMCNGDLSSAIRVHRERRPPLPKVYGASFFDELDEFLPHAERINLLGGEPFLGVEPLRVLERLVQLGLTPWVHVNTNGTQWSPRVQQLARRLPMHIAVSVDGATRDTVKSIRRGVDFGLLERNIESMRSQVTAAGGVFSLTFCLMVSNWHEFADVLLWGDRLDVDVSVNTVTNPAVDSLLHLPDASLARIVAELDRSAGRVGRSSRNRHVWDRELARLGSALSARAGRANLSAETLVEEADRRARSWSDGAPVLRVDLDRDQLIRSIAAAGEGAPLGLDAVVGSPAIALLEHLGPRLGELVETAISLDAVGIETRDFRYRSPTGDTRVHAIMAHAAAGDVWFVAMRSAERLEFDGHDD